MNKKGVSLPINVLVVLAIAIVVLLGVLAFFSGSLNPTQESTSDMNEFNTCCTSYVMDNICERDPINYQCPNTGDTISSEALDLDIQSDQVRDRCGCP